MKRWIAVGVLLPALLSGCNVSQTSLEGHDLLDSGLSNLKVGIDEYHADDAERMKVARGKLTHAFVADVLGGASDKAKVKATTEKFIELLERAEVAEQVEATRYANLLNSIRAMREVNGSLRDLTQIKLGWKSEVVEYVGRLRRKVVEHGPGK